jgi:hypothetical protein
MLEIIPSLEMNFVIQTTFFYPIKRKGVLSFSCRIYYDLLVRTFLITLPLFKVKTLWSFI